MHTHQVQWQRPLEGHFCLAKVLELLVGLAECAQRACHLKTALVLGYQFL